jgi:N-acetylglucosaminyldiphosphoundecaprenol N-acetyl-beta-D-mannosaminyltransferase
MVAHLNAPAPRGQRTPDEPAEPHRGAQSPHRAGPPPLPDFPPRPETVDILGVPIARVGYAATFAHIAAWVADARATEAAGSARPPARQLCTVNPEFLVDAARQPDFRTVLQQADLNVADGVGVAWAASLLGAPVPERVTGSDGIFRLCEEAAQRGWSVYFLGAAPGVADATAMLMAERYTGLRVTGSYSGSPTADEWPVIEARLFEAQPDLLFVAFGHPRQDLWIAAHRNELSSHVAIGVGGAFDFAVGIAPRAPVWLRNLGLEWAHRLVTQPWRWRRMLKLPLFVLLVLRQRLSR